MKNSSFQRAVKQVDLSIGKLVKDLPEIARKFQFLDRAKEISFGGTVEYSRYRIISLGIDPENGEWVERGPRTILKQPTNTCPSILSDILITSKDL